MHRTQKHIISLLVCLLVCGKLFSQQVQYQFTRVDINEGLSHNQVNCILKDKQGFLWFGTLSGLNRYDGYNFEVFRHNAKDSASISDNFITAIYPLPENKLWIVTRNGINIYDPATEKFDQGYGNYLQKLSLPNSAVNNIVEDKKQNFWFLFPQNGLYRYSSSAKKVFYIKHIPRDNASPLTNDIISFAQDNEGNYWLIDHNGMIEKMDGHTFKIISRKDDLFNINHGVLQAYNLFIDAQNCLWIYVSGDAKGVYYLNPQVAGSFKHLTKDAGATRLNNNIIYGITQDNKGIIWIGTDHGGINLLNKEDFSVQYLLNNPEDEKSISQNSVYALYKDNTSIIWAGTYKKGIDYYNENLNRFTLYKHESSNPNSLSYDDVNRFVEDKKGNLWIGTNGGGLIYFDRQQNTFKQFLHDPDNANSLCNNVIVSLCFDDKNQLWIGTYFGGLDCYNGKTFTHYRHDPNDPHSLINDKVWDIFKDAKNNLWIGTLGGGLERFDPEKKIFVHYSSNIFNQDYISVITEDAHSNLWIGTAGGIEVMNIATGKIIHYGYHAADANSLSNDNVNCILPGYRGWIWAGTREGLCRFDPATKKFHTFTIADGLPDNTILTMLQDNAHNLWIATPDGLSNLLIQTDAASGKYTFTFKNYDELDGLQSREFNEKAAYKMRNGNLIFGGPNGFNMFDPAKIKINTHVPPVVFTNLQVFNKNISVGEKIHGQVILKKSLTETPAIILHHNENDFSVEFAALSYSHSAKNKYAYKLEGFNKEWIITDGKLRKATYTNLDAGKYIFHVKATNNDGVWNEKGATLQITILPPFWKTPLAYLIYALLIIAALLLARKIILDRERMRFSITQQQQEAQRLHELDMMKIRFFTNLSHEFRTPLTLILTPIEKIMKHTHDAAQKKQFQLIQRNAKRLLNLVNQLLDFRKMEVQEIKLNPAPGNIIFFINEAANSFTDIADKKNIHFIVQSSVESLETSFDADKLERILFNLLSNAFKFTMENGTIILSINLLPATKENDIAYLEIKVKDTGIGIPKEKQEKIFERFFQSDLPGSLLNQGSGIGLSITREFVRLHNGTITVESAPGEGSSFTVLLPVTNYTDQENNVQQSEMTTILQSKEKIIREENNVKYNPHRATILLIEDNEDFRFYLKDNLRIYFNILEAGDGKEGWEKALSGKPDLIVSDIMMPGMNGIELSKKIKKDPRTAGIPIILLTARASEEQQLEGFETGANDYITKPFNFEILLSRIRNLLSEKKAQKKAAHPAQADIAPAEINITSAEEKLLKEAMAAVEKNISNPDFSVEELSHALFMSRVGLYKKLLAITGKTPIEFIRTVRLKRAAQLLEKSQMTVAEVAYEVGFNNPKYFTKYFKQEFKVLPSEYKKPGV